MMNARKAGSLALKGRHTDMLTHEKDKAPHHNQQHAHHLLNECNTAVESNSTRLTDVASIQNSHEPAASSIIQ
jgi:hypothetical protein